MAICKNCKKKGFFLMVNADGDCADCVRLALIKSDEDKHSHALADLLSRIVERKEELERLASDRSQLIAEYQTQARESALRELESDIQRHKSDLYGLVWDIDQNGKKKAAAEEELDRVLRKLKGANNTLIRSKELALSVNYLNRFYVHEFNESWVTSVNEVLEPVVKLKLHSMDLKDLRSAFKVNQKVIEELLDGYATRYSTKANRTIYHLMVIGLGSELQNILYALKYEKLDQAIAQVKEVTKKYAQIASSGNQSIVGTVKEFIGRLEYLYIEAIEIEYQYYTQKERIKEEQKALREQMRQEKAELKHLEEQRKKIEAEEGKYILEIENIVNQMQETMDRVVRGQLEDRMARVKTQLDEVKHKKEDIIRLQNGMAGYIYIISNLGTFGENIFKIGMTRRLDPQERVDELGDASVPFRFDVHSFIFSNRAPELERSLHKRLHHKRVNKVNLRKEFFQCTIDELEEIVFFLEPTAEFNRTMLAEHYFQSQSLADVPEYDESMEAVPEDTEAERIATASSEAVVFCS